MAQVNSLLAEQMRIACSHVQYSFYRAGFRIRKQLMRLRDFSKSIQTQQYVHLLNTSITTVGTIYFIFLFKTYGSNTLHIYMYCFLVLDVVNICMALTSLV